MDGMKWNKCERPDISEKEQEELKKVFGPNFEHCNFQMKAKMRTRRNWKKVWERQKYTVYGFLTGIVISIILYFMIQFYH